MKNSSSPLTRRVQGILLILILFPFQDVWAWGPVGHRIVGEIAEKHLLPEVKIKIEKNFNIKKLADVANWADRVRKKRSQGPWHFCNIEASERSYDRDRDCPYGDCVVEKIVEFARFLKGRGSFQNLEKTQPPPSPLSSPPRGRGRNSFSPLGSTHRMTDLDEGSPSYAKLSRGRGLADKEGKEALMYLVHFVGDVHQPLHLGNAQDRGGNKISLVFKGQPTNLHALWDGGLIYLAGKNLVQYARDLNRRISPVEKDQWNLSEVTEWANESRVLALDHAYRSEEVLSKRYIEKSREIIDLRLSQAGVRLAGLLNGLLK